jgi:hypothetical protein
MICRSVPIFEFHAEHYPIAAEVGHRICHPFNDVQPDRWERCRCLEAWPAGFVRCSEPVGPSRPLRRNEEDAWRVISNEDLVCR